MLRVLLMLMIAIATGAGGYLFLRPSALQPATPLHSAHHASPDPSLASLVVLPAGPQTHPPRVAKLAVRARLPLHTRAASAANPPRAAHRHKAAAPPLLHLPKVLPARVLSVPILMYHHISSRPAADAISYGLTVTDADFAAQLAYLHRQGFHTILLRQLFAALYRGAPLPSHPIVLTFDDGYLDNYTDALPILQRAHDVGEFNIISAYPGITLGVNSYMTWQQLKALVAAGMEIGSHTVDHQDLGTLPEDHVRFELRDSRNILQRTLGVPVQFLAYPSGEPFRSGSPAAQQELLTLVPQYGYVGALLDGPLTTSQQNAQAPFQLQRIRVSGGESLQAFANSLLL